MFSNSTMEIGTVHPIIVIPTPDPDTGYEGYFYAAGAAISQDWYFAVGNLNGWITAEVTRQNNHFTAYVNYHIQDMYRWRPGSQLRGGLVDDGQMAQLHAAGFAKEYEQFGLEKYKITWTYGQRINEGAVMMEWN